MTGGRPCMSGPVPFHTPSPGRGCEKTGVIRGGRGSDRCRLAFTTGAVPTPTAGRE